MTGSFGFAMLFGGMKQWVGALGLSGMGFFIAGVLILAILGGRWLDKRFGIEPWGLITGLVLGIGVVVYGVYNMIKPFIGNKKNGEE